VETARSKIFPYFVGLAALFVAGSAAFYSVFGLSKLFSGATFAVIIMAGSLEFAKLVSASFLYRYWTKINLWLKYYMVVGVVTLVIITSAGIFGFLSNAYQGATIEFEKESTVLLYKEDRLSQLEEDKQYLKDELEFAIAELPDNYITAKRKLRTDYNSKVLEINDEILGIKAEIGDLKTALIETGVDVGPAIYLARSFGTDVDSVVKFFIFILIFVFDPMAVALVLSYNIAMVNRQQGSLDPSPSPPEKKRPKRLGLYKEGKSMMEKIVKETFSPDEEEVKKDDEVIEAKLVEHDTSLPEDEKIETPEERGSIQFPEVIKKVK
tara:strand:+ start:1513 stop:2484 length:972 start_codon:yes stop_codon:yes gene_type:complete